MTPGQDIERSLLEAEAVCRTRGLRFTPARRSIMEHLLTADQPLSAYDLLSRLRPGDPPAPPSVYRNLGFLLEHGLIHRLETTRAYVACRHPDHSHSAQFLICRRCGSVVEASDEHITASVGALGQHLGFALELCAVELRGVCAKCQSQCRCDQRHQEGDQTSRQSA
jgi:Fur family transcriptional regulator, zinc uptake regulator